MRNAFLLTVALLAGCATSGTPGVAGEPDGACRGDDLQRFVGQTATGALGAEMLKTSGATTLRWVPPNTAVTMDFRADRLTVSYDADYKIVSASCG